MRVNIKIFLFLVLFACKPNLSFEKDEAIRVTDTVKVLVEARKNVLYNNKTLEGIDTLEVKLQNEDYHLELFYSYHALVFGYLFLNNIEKADSIWNIIIEDNLSSDQKFLWLGDGYMIHLESKRYLVALSFLEQIYQHPSSQMSAPVQKTFYNYEKWRVYSTINECDSARLYLELYIISLSEAEDAYKLQNVDSLKLNYLKNQLNWECPLTDSIGESIWRTVPWSW